MTRLVLSNDLFHYFKYIRAIESNWRVLLLWAEVLGLSVCAFMIIRMKYDSAIFSLLLSLMDVILTQLLVQYMSEVSHTCHTAISLGQSGSLGYILNASLKTL